MPISKKHSREETETTLRGIGVHKVEEANLEDAIPYRKHERLFRYWFKTPMGNDKSCCLMFDETNIDTFYRLAERRVDDAEYRIIPCKPSSRAKRSKSQ